MKDRATYWVVLSSWEVGVELLYRNDLFHSSKQTESMWFTCMSNLRFLDWHFSQFYQSIISKCSFSLRSLVPVFFCLAPAFFLLCPLFLWWRLSFSFAELHFVFLLLSFSISCVSVRTYGNVTARKVSHYRAKQKLFTSFVFTLLLFSSFSLQLSFPIKRSKILLKQIFQLLRIENLYNL